MLCSCCSSFIFSTGETIIARTWHGAVPVDKADAYYDYLLETGVPDYKSTPGNRGVYVLRRVEGETAHFLLLVPRCHLNGTVQHYQ